MLDAAQPVPRPHLPIPRRPLRLRSDAALAERFADGDESAFAVLFERHRASVLAVCIGVLGSSHDAEDAAQDAFASLAAALHRAPPLALRAWLARVARNAAIDVARRRRSRSFADCEIPEDGGFATDRVIASHGLRVELESVISGIKELPESQRTALLMRELAGHSYAEIAALLDTDEQAVRGLIARARMGLRSHREAAELSCAEARAEIAAEPDGRRHGKTVRRHIRNCAACRSYRHALRDDARALRGLAPLSGGGLAGGGAVFGGLAAKGALIGTAVSQLTAACAVSVCAVGGIVLLSPPGDARDRVHGAAVAAGRAVSSAKPAGAAVTRAATGVPLRGSVARASSTATALTGGAWQVSTTGTLGSHKSPGGSAVHSAPSATVPGRFTTPVAGTLRSGSPSHPMGTFAGSPAPAAPATGTGSASPGAQAAAVPLGSAGPGAPARSGAGNVGSLGGAAGSAPPTPAIGQQSWSWSGHSSGATTPAPGTSATAGFDGSGGGGQPAGLDSSGGRPGTSAP